MFLIFYNIRYIELFLVPSSYINSILYLQDSSRTPLNIFLDTGN